MSTKERSEPTDEEIRQMMDFDGLLNAYQATKVATVHKRPIHWTKITIGSAIIIASIYGVYWWQSNSSVKNNPMEEAQNTVLIPNEVSAESEPKVAQLDTSFKTIVKSTPSIKPRVSIARIPVAEQVELNGAPPHYLNAEPIDGFPVLYGYFDRELKYPVDATKDSIQGVESVAFIIDKKGIPGKIEILHSLGPDFDKEVLRILEHMPPWKPATLNGQPVSSKVSLPFSFRITSGKK